MMSNECPMFPFAREAGYEPSRAMAQMREHDPVSLVELFDGTKAWAVMKHKDICQALSSDKLSADRRVHGFPEIHAGGAKAHSAKPTFVNLDDPEHQKQRDMLETAFEPKHVANMSIMMQGVVDAVLEEMVRDHEGRHADLVESFCSAVPERIIYKVLGVPDKDVQELAHDSEIRHSTSRDAIELANTHLREYIQGLVEKRIAQPGDDLISMLVVEQYQHGHLTKEDMFNLALLVLTAGNAALTNSMALGVISLLQHPDQLEAFMREPSLGPMVVNEILRYHTVSGLNSRRVAREKIEIGGRSIEAGQGVICVVQSGDRDDEAHAEADKFDIFRKDEPRAILGFGYGAHRCLAEAFNRQQLEIALTTLFRRLPTLKLAVAEEELEYSGARQNIGLVHLPVQW